MKWNGWVREREREKEVGIDLSSFFFPSREEKKKKRKKRSCSRAIIIDISVQESKQDTSPSLVKSKSIESLSTWANSQIDGQSRLWMRRGRRRYNDVHVRTRL